MAQRSPLRPTGTLRSLLPVAVVIVIATVALAAGMLLEELRLASTEQELVRGSRDAGRLLADELTQEQVRHPGRDLAALVAERGFARRAEKLLRSRPAIVYLRVVDTDGNVVWTSETASSTDSWQKGRLGDFLSSGARRTRVPTPEQDDSDLFLELVSGIGGQPSPGTVVLGLSEDGMARQFRRELWKTIVFLVGFGLAVLVVVAVVYQGFAQRRGEQLLQRAHEEHLAELGMLAAGLAHELRNPLNALRFATDSLELRARRLGGEAADTSEVSTEMVGITGEMAEEIGGLDHILSSFLAYARPPTEEAEEIDVESLCRSAANVAAPSFATRGVQLELAMPEEAIQVRQVPGRLRQVLINLLLNAADACGPGGRVRLTAARAGERLRLDVEDDGPGVPESLETTLFEPFTTSKAHGTGLGLAICRRLVSEMQGRIAYRRAATGGSRFEIELPNQPGPPRPSLQETPR